MGKRSGAASGVVLACAMLAGCTTAPPDAVPAVDGADLQADIARRLAEAGEQPQSVTLRRPARRRGRPDGALRGGAESDQQFRADHHRDEHRRADDQLRDDPRAVRRSAGTSGGAAGGRRGTGDRQGGGVPVGSGGYGRRVGAVRRHHGRRHAAAHRRGHRRRGPDDELHPRAGADQGRGREHPARRTRHPSGQAAGCRRLCRRPRGASGQHGRLHGDRRRRTRGVAADGHHRRRRQDRLQLRAAPTERLSSVRRQRLPLRR